MKFILSLLLAVATGIGAMHAAELSDTISVARVFIDSQSKTLDVLQRSTRMDMVDYAKAGTEHKAINEFYGISKITALTDSCIDIELTQVSTAQIFTLPTSRGGIAAIIYTVNADSVADSQIEFFDGNLAPLKLIDCFKPPLLSEFIRADFKKDKKIVNMLNTVIPFISVKYIYEPKECTLTASLSVKGLLTDEDFKLVCDYLYNTLTYRWDGKKFSLARQQ